MIQKTYPTPENLLKGEPLLVNALVSSGLRADYLLSRIGSKRGPYSTLHLTELLSKVNKEALSKLLTERSNDKPTKYASGRTKEMSADDPVFLIDTISEFGRTTQIEAFDTLLLLLTPELSAFVRDMRIVLKIPTKGLSDWKNRVAHFKKLNKETLWRHGDEKSLNRSGDFLLSAISFYINERTIFSGVEPGRGDLIQTMLFDHITMNDPFYFLKLKDDPHGQYSLGSKLYEPVRAHSGTRSPLTSKRFVNDSVDIMIAIYPTTTKEEAKAAIDENWKVVELMKKKLPPLPTRERLKNPESLKKALEVYTAHLEKKNYKKISYEFGIPESRAKRIVSDIRKRIKQLQKFVPVR